MTFDEILAFEGAVANRPVRYVNGWEHLGHGHHIQVLLYEYDDPNVGTFMRLATAVNGHVVGGTIVGTRGREQG